MIRLTPSRELPMPAYWFQTPRFGGGSLTIVPAFLILAACASPAPPTPEPVVVTQEVRIPIPVPCIGTDDIPPAREYADQRARRELAEGALAPPSLFRQVQILGEGIKERDEDMPDLRAALVACAVP